MNKYDDDDINNIVRRALRLSSLIHKCFVSKNSKTP